MSNAYICVSHAKADRTNADHICLLLERYGFRYRCVDEDTPPDVRGALFAHAAVPMALTSPAAEAVETVAADIRRALSGGAEVLCITLRENELDERFAAGGGAAHRIPAPIGATPDRHSVALFMHRVFVRYLSRHPACFSELLCTDDVYGRVIACAVRASAGDGPACYALGRAYEKGHGVPALESEAARWIARAAEVGVTDACIRMGELCLSGTGVAKDEARAMTLFTAAAETGDTRGDFHLGICYLYGHGVLRDPERGVTYLLAAAECGYAPALYRLGLCYRDGIGVTADYHKALVCLREACRHGAVEPDRPKETFLSQREDHAAWQQVAALLAEGNAGRPLAPGGEEVCDPYAEAANPLSVPTSTADPAVRIPTLYGRRAGQKPARMTVRQLRRLHVTSGAIVARTKAMVAAERRTLSAHELEERLKRSFASSAYRLMGESEAMHTPDWLAEFTRAPRITEPETAGTDTLSLHTDYALARAALVLARLLAAGDTLHGRGLPRHTRAVVWYRYAAACGHRDAIYELAELYRGGKGVLPAPARAVALYRVAAETEDKRGCYALALAYERGFCVPRDAAEAVRLYEKAAEEGYAPAQTNLGRCFELGQGVMQSAATAVEWYTRAAAQNRPEAVCRLGLCYEQGQGVARDADYARRLYAAAAQLGHPYALYRLGLCRSFGEPMPADTAVLPSTEAVGDAAGALASPYTEAVRLWHRAAERGVSEAAYALALCYAKGQGVRRDEEASITYLCMAAEAGHMQATYRLGLCALEGCGVLRNERKAMALFARTVRLWAMYRADPVRTGYREDAAPDRLPRHALTPAEAVGSAGYLLGYGILYEIGDAAMWATASDTELFADTHAVNGYRVTGGGRRYKGAHAEQFSYSADQKTVLRVAPKLLRRTEPIHRTLSQPARVAMAVSCLEQAAELGHVAALTLLGDLCRYGYRAPTLMGGASEAETFYIRAAEAARRARRSEASRAPLDPRALADRSFESANELLSRPDRIEASLQSPIHARKSLAQMYLARTTTHAAVGERVDDEAAGLAWRYLAETAELGSLDALVGMAYCTYCGYGTPMNRTASRWFLSRAMKMEEGRVAAALWLGDFLWESALCGASPASEAERSPVADRREIDEADDTYLRATRTPIAAECGGYILRERRAAREAEDRRYVAEAHNRLAVLRAVHPGRTPERRDAFTHLATAIRMKDETALEDLARMYAHEIRYVEATAPASDPTKQESRTVGVRDRLVGMNARHRYRRRAERAGGDQPRAVRTPQEWMTAYYTAHYPLPVPFSGAFRDQTPEAEQPAYVRAAVTPIMRVEALSYLADCFYDGYGLAKDEAAAVELWQAVVDTKLQLGRGELPPEGVLKARYSLGWCLLHGVGITENARAAIPHFTAAAHYHSEAAFCLAECCERGIGVDNRDDREAIKYYRKAESLGHPLAKARLDVLQKRLKEAAERAEDEA